MAKSKRQTVYARADASIKRIMASVTDNFRYGRSTIPQTADAFLEYLECYARAGWYKGYEYGKRDGRR